MPLSKWTIEQEGGTGGWAVYKNGVKHGRSHSKQEQAEAARKNFEADEIRQEREAAKKEKK